MALRYFAGSSPWDLVVTHGVSYASLLTSIWGVVDVINTCPDMSYNFPTKQQQLHNAYYFQKMSGAGFSNVIGAIDGMLVWTLRPTEADCHYAKCGSKKFFCSRKDKFGFNLQAICDHELRFIWIDIRWPGSTSDYMA